MLKKSIYILIYILFINWIYLDYISIKWAYFGASSSFSLSGLFISILISFISGIPLLKLKKLNTGGFVALLLYYYTYIPMAVVLSYYCLERNEFIQYLVAISLSFFFFAYLGSKNFNKKLRFGELEVFKKMNSLLFINILLGFGVLILLREDLNFVNPFGDNVYDQRFNARDSVSRSVILDYLIMLSSGVITPLIFSYGIYSRRMELVISAILQVFLLYSVAANKAFIFSLFLILLVSKLSQKPNFFLYFLKNNVILSFVILFFWLVSDGSILFEGFMAIFAVRFVMISGINAINYIDFFLNHEKTYYSHLNIVNYFTNAYPYGDLQIGQVIGEHFYNMADANFNANFFLTDGVAASGIFGVVMIGIVGGILLLVINVLVAKHDYRFILMPFSLIAVLLMNISIFTTLFSGGLLFLIFYLIALKPRSI